MVLISPNRQQVLGLLAPHAGYVYSGACAGQGYGRVTLSETVIILGVNHRGGGAPLAVDGNDFWETPLGNVAINSELRSRLLSASKSVRPGQRGRPPGAFTGSPGAVYPI